MPAEELKNPIEGIERYSSIPFGIPNPYFWNPIEGIERFLRTCDQRIVIGSNPIEGIESLILPQLF